MRYGWKVIWGLFTVLALSTSAFAQRTTGGLTGTVKDNTGAVIPGVTVTLTGEFVMGTPTSVTNENGVYRFLNLSPGTYNMTFTLTGFADFNRQGLVVSVGMTTEENVTLQLSSVSESITSERWRLSSSPCRLRGGMGVSTAGAPPSMASFWVTSNFTSTPDPRGARGRI